MRGTSLLAYAAANVLRARRRSASILVGLTLAVATIATPLVALDTEVRALVDRLASSIPYDYHTFGGLEAYENASAAAASVDGIVAAEPILPAPTTGRLAGLRGPSGANFARPVLGFMFVRPSFAGVADRFGFSGPFELDEGEIAITDRVAGRMGARVGDPVLAWAIVPVCEQRPPVCHEENWTANLTVRAILTTPVGPEESTPFRLPGYSYSREAVVFAGFASLESLGDSLSLSLPLPRHTTLLVWADRGRLVNSYDPGATEAAVLRLARELEFALVPWGLSAGEASGPVTGLTLSGVVRSVNDSMAFQIGVVLVLSLPTVALALLFARIGIEVGLARRRREIGILRSRGWSSGEIVAGLLLEAVLLGSAAALAGLGLAALVSRAFLGLTSASFPGGLQVAFTDLAVSPLTALITVAGAVLGAFVVAYPSVQRVSRLRIVRALHYVSPVETAVQYRRVNAWALVAIGVVGLVLIIDFRGVPTSAGPLPLVLGVVRAILILLAPVPLIVGVTQIVTLGSRRPYRALSRMVRPWTGDLHFLVAEGLQRNPRRSSHLATIVAFGLAFAIFVVGLLGVIEANEARQSRTTVGGDLYFQSTAVSRADLEGLAVDARVAAVAVADFVRTDTGTLIALDAANYSRAVPWLDAYYFVEGGPSAIAALATGGAIPDEILATSQGLHVGDPLVVDLIVNRYLSRIPTRVVAVARVLPGLPPSDMMGWTAGSIAVDISSVQAAGVTAYLTTAPGRRAILRVAQGVDPHDFARSLRDRWIGSAEVAEDVLATIRGDPFRATLFGHLYTQAGLAILVLVVAVGLTAYASGVEREGEFATIAARGVSGGGLAALLLGEGLSVGIIGTLLAVPVVLVFLDVFVQFLGTTRAGPPMEFFVPWTAWSLLVGAVGAVVLGTALAGLRLRRMNLPQVLKLRGL